jgi:hypothetical protein
LDDFREAEWEEKVGEKGKKKEKIMELIHKDFYERRRYVKILTYYFIPVVLVP